MDSALSPVSSQQSGRKRSWSELVDSTPVSSSSTCLTYPTTASSREELNLNFKKTCLVGPCHCTISPLPAPCDGTTPRWETLGEALAYFGRHRQHSKMYRLAATVPPQESWPPSINSPSHAQLVNIATIVTWNSFFVEEFRPLHPQDDIIPAASSVNVFKAAAASLPNFDFNLLYLLADIISHYTIAFRLDVDIITMALIVMGRRRSNSPLTAAPHMQFIVAIILAKKVLDDVVLSTAWWARAVNIEHRELVELEWEFTKAINWGFAVGEEE